MYLKYVYLLTFMVTNKLTSVLHVNYEYALRHVLCYGAELAVLHLDIRTYILLKIQCHYP